MTTKLGYWRPAVMYLNKENLRWRKGRLEQLWENYMPASSLDGGHGEYLIKTEWRLVPTVKD